MRFGISRPFATKTLGAPGNKRGSGSGVSSDAHMSVSRVPKTISVSVIGLGVS